MIRGLSEWAGRRVGIEAGAGVRAGNNGEHVDQDAAMRAIAEHRAGERATVAWAAASALGGWVSVVLIHDILLRGWRREPGTFERLDRSAGLNGPEPAVAIAGGASLVVALALASAAGSPPTGAATLYERIGWDRWASRLSISALVLSIGTMVLLLTQISVRGFGVWFALAVPVVLAFLLASGVEARRDAQLAAVPVRRRLEHMRKQQGALLEHRPSLEQPSLRARTWCAVLVLIGIGLAPAVAVALVRACTAEEVPAGEIAAWVAVGLMFAVVVPPSFARWWSARVRRVSWEKWSFLTVGAIFGLMFPWLALAVADGRRWYAVAVISSWFLAVGIALGWADRGVLGRFVMHLDAHSARLEVARLEARLGEIAPRHESAGKGRFGRRFGR